MTSWRLFFFFRVLFTNHASDVDDRTDVVLQDASIPNRQVEPWSTEGPATDPVVIVPCLGDSQGASFPDLGVTRTCPLVVLVGKYVGGENNSNHKQSLSIEQTACTCTVAASSSLCLHGNIHFDMQIPPPFVQCSTEGNIDFSERQRAFALIVKLQLYPSFFLFFCWLLLQLNFSMSYLSFFPRCGAKTVCWSRGFHSEEER